MFFPVERLVNKLNLLEADLLAQQQRGVRNTRCDALQFLFRVGDNGRVVREENVPNQPLQRLGVRS